QSVLDFRWVDVDAADDEHVLDPADDAQAAAVVDHTEVTGAQPSVRRQGLCRRVRVVEVTGHDRLAADDDLTRFARGDVAASAVGDADLEPRAGPAHGGGDGLEVVLR